jgi:hypothetical protein
VGKDGALLGPSEGNGSTLPSDLERPKYLEPHDGTVRLMGAPGKAGRPLPLHGSILLPAA